MYPSPYPAPFISPHMRANIVKILLAVGAIATGISLLVEAVSLGFPVSEDQEFDANPAGFALALIIFLLAVLELLIYITTVVFFCVWLYRAYANLKVFDRSNVLDYSPGLAVGGFFIPFANLVIPYRAVRETWQKSGTPEESAFALPSAPASFPLWWTFWLAAGFVGKISMRVSFNDSVPHSTATMIGIAAGALSIIAAVFAYFVVDAIDQKQEETTAKLGLGPFSRPQPPPAYMRDPVMNEGSGL